MGTSEGRGIRRAAWAALLAIALAGALASVFPAQDPDTYFHLAIGREIAAAGTVPRTETLCFWAQGEPFVNHEWLFDLMAWGAYDLGGDLGVTAFRALLSGGLFALAALLALRLGASPAFAFSSIVAFLPIFRMSLEVRPHLAAYLLAAASLLVVTGRRAGVGRIAALAGLAVLWANTHGSFPVALAIAGLWVVMPTGEAADGLRERLRRASSVVAVALATLLNPWGIDLIGTVLHHTDRRILDLVPEWWPVAWGDLPAFDGLFLALIAGTLLSFLPRPNRGRVADLGLVLLFLVPAAVSQKFTLGMAVGLSPVLAGHATRALAPDPRRSRWVAAGLLVLALGSALLLSPRIPPGARVGVGFDRAQTPADAMAWAQRHDLQGRWFVPVDQGGFLAWAVPGMRPVLDGRTYVHGVDRVLAYVGALADPANFQRMHDALRFDGVLADYLDPAFPRLVEALRDDPAWILAWIDSRFAVFVPATVAAASNGRIQGFEILRPTANPLYLFDLTADEVARIQAEIDRVRAAPQGRGLSLLADGLLALREAGLGWAPGEALVAGADPVVCARAGEHLTALVASRPDVPMYRYFQAIALACQGRCARAAEALSRIPGFPDARVLARRIANGECVVEEGSVSVERPGTR
jgi:hypothetical protein